MQTDIKTIKKHFNKSINKYSENAVVQKLTAEKLAEYLNGNFFDKILEVGAGTGLFTKALTENVNFNQYFANDLIDKSEEYIKKYVSDIKFFCGDFRRIHFSNKFDLIASNAVFQWFNNIDKVFDLCKNIINKNGILAFSTFSPDNFKEFRNITGLGLEYKTKNELINLLHPNFDIIKSEEFEQVLTFDNPLKILAHMKNTGVNSLSLTPWNIQEIKDFCEKYSNKYPNLQLTYSPIIIVAKLK